MDALLEARKKYQEAEYILRGSAAEAIDTACRALLNNPGITSVSWAQKSSEYNDEGMYPGIHGPVINTDRKEDEDYGGRIPGWAYGYDERPSDPRVSALSQVLRAVGEDILSDTFGDSYFITATLVDGRVEYDKEDTGW